MTIAVNFTSALQTIETLQLLGQSSQFNHTELNELGQNLGLASTPPCGKIAVEAVWPGEVAKWAGDGAVAFPLTGARGKREKALSAALEAVAPHVFVLANIEMARDRSYLT